MSVIVVRPINRRVIVRRPGPPGPNALSMLTDVDLTGSVVGSIMGELASGKWGPVMRVSDFTALATALTAEIANRAAAIQTTQNMAAAWAVAMG